MALATVPDDDDDICIFVLTCLFVAPNEGLCPKGISPVF